VTRRNETMFKVEKISDERGRVLIQDPPVADRKSVV
jgi:hypothetical protein